MSRFTTIKTIASTLMIAVTAGFVVQYGESMPRIGNGEPTEVYNKAPRSLMLSTNALGEAVFGVPNVVTTPLDHAANQLHIVAVDVVYTEFDVPRFDAIMATPIVGCGTNLSAAREPAAIVTLNVASPCNEEETFTLSHGGMTISGNTDRDGNATLRVPVLDTQAVFNVSFDNVLKASTKIFVPELRRYDRAVLQWMTNDNMRLHALENDAQIGDPGHVWSASLHSAEDTRAGRNGFVLYLGQTDVEIPYQAEVYTFPQGLMSRDGDVDLRVGITVTAENCGREVDAVTIQTNAGESLRETEFSSQMPPCAQIGEVAMLRNKFSDLTLVSN